MGILLQSEFNMQNSYILPEYILSNETNKLLTQSHQLSALWIPSATQ